MSYRLTLMITISLLIAVSFSLGGTILINASFNSSLEKETEAALESFETIQNTLYLLNSMSEQTGFDNLKEALARMAEQGVGGWQGLVLKTDDHIIYRNRTETMEGYLLPALTTSASYIYVNDDRGNGLLVLGTINAGERQLTLQARFDLSDIYETRQMQQQFYVLAYIVVVTLGVVVSIVLSFSLTRRLHQLTAAVRKIAGGDLSTRSGIGSSDEFGQLSRDFDTMADRLQQNINHMEMQMQRQEAFMGAFAHELKTPMTSIIGFADLLRQGNLDENTRMMASEYIYSEGRRLEKLSFKLLDLILLKKDSLVMRKVWLAGFVEEVDKAMTQNLKNRGVRLICRSEQGRVLLEPDLVKSLLYNLMDNAAKAMDTDGIIALKASVIPGGCQFVVLDNGRGMEEKELSKITEAFYRVDKSRSRQQGGAGLGLALCKQIVELHNGRLHYESKPGVGTKVTVTLCGKAEEKT